MSPEQSLRGQIALVLAATLLVGAGLSSAAAVGVLHHATLLERNAGRTALVKTLASGIAAACRDDAACAERAASAAASTGAVQVVKAKGAQRSDDRETELPGGVGFVADGVEGAPAIVTPLLVAYLLLASFFVFLLATFLLNRLVARPLDRLAQAAERIGRMDLEDPFGGRAPMLGQLGSAFERMAVSLKQERERVAEQIRELERLNRELQDARDSLVRTEKLATVGRLAAGVAHEVGNPLGAILGYLELARARAPADAREFLDRIDKEVARIDRTVRELLDYSRPGAPAPVPIPLKDAVDGAVRLAMVQKRLKHVQFDVEVAPALTVLADAHHLSQVLVNLLLNAGDAMNGEGTIRIRAEGALLPAGRRATDPPPGKRVLLTVADTGPGIAPADLPRIFDPFFTTKDPGEGTGLGLSISHRIMEGFGGEIRAANDPAGGAVFTLAFRTPDENG